ncbi:MAG: HEPN domain-containing protein [Gammaproteobacteria bacterium]|nr:HEPN domain-containing protein [Gammaproteobacteria bacterium]
MPDLRNARNLLVMARKDFAAACAMKDSQIFADEIFGFHIQQAAEKSLKAWMASLGLEYPFRHDLGELLSALEQEGNDVTPYWDLLEYTDFGVRFRYETLSVEEPVIDRDAACANLQKLVEHVEKLF